MRPLARSLGHVLNATIGPGLRLRLKSVAIDPVRPIVTGFSPHLKTQPKKTQLQAKSSYSHVFLTYSCVLKTWLQNLFFFFFLCSGTSQPTINKQENNGSPCLRSLLGLNWLNLGSIVFSLGGFQLVYLLFLDKIIFQVSKQQLLYHPGCQCSYTLHMPPNMCELPNNWIINTMLHCQQTNALIDIVNNRLIGIIALDRKHVWKWFFYFLFFTNACIFFKLILYLFIRFEF